jgi:hypothetical protein
VLSGVVPNETLRAAETVASLIVDCVGDPTPGARGSRTLAVIVQSKVRSVTDGGPNRFTVADAPEIVRRSMARANHVGLPLKRSYAVNRNTVHERNWRRRFPAACFPVLPRKRYGNWPRFVRWTRLNLAAADIRAACSGRRPHRSA